MTQQGWIKLHRKMTDWEWYSDVPVKVLFIHLILTANHTEMNWRGIKVGRGELVSTLSQLSHDTGLSVGQIRCAMKKLIKTGEIDVKTTNSYTLVKCLNYAVYQSREYDAEQTDGNQSANKKQSNCNKQEYKNNKNKKNVKRLSRNIGFDIEEIARRAKLNDNYEL